MAEGRRVRNKAVSAEAVEVIPADDEQADEKLVEEAVVWIREKVESTVHKGATEIGMYVLEKFFGGDPERVRSKNPYKNASFSGLIGRCETVEFPIAKSTLHNAVALAMMRQLIPGKGAAFPQLPPSHQTALLPLRDPAKVEKLAQRANTKALSVRELRALVTEEVARAPKDADGRGRPPKPLIVKTLDRSLKLFTLESGRRSFTNAHVKDLSDDQKKHALKAASDLVTSLNQLIEKLKQK